MPDFKQFNLFYGWNYSGKTTLSRVFRCFEQKKPHPDFLSADAQLVSASGPIHQLSTPNNAPVFRVFNSDFIKENLRFDSGSATPILVLGAEDIAKKETLKIKKDDREKIIAAKAADITKKGLQTRDIENGLTSYARDFIKNPLNVPSYDKTKFQSKVELCKDRSTDFVLDEADLVSCTASYNSNEKKPLLSTKSLAFTSLAEIRDEVTSLLERVVTESNPISRLKDDPLLEKWVNEGRLLHEEKTTCQFCTQPITADFLNALAGHFSAEYDNLMSSIASLIEKLQQAKDENLTLEDKAVFYADLASEYDKHRAVFGKMLKKRGLSLDGLIKALRKKQTSAFSKQECPTIDDPTSQMEDAINKINDAITAHNKKTNDFDDKKKEMFGRLENHYAASFVQQKRYNETKKEVAELESAIKAQEGKIAALDVEIKDLEKSVSEASKGADQINNLLVEYFGKKDLQIAAIGEAEFQIFRQGIIAKNLSEGEKTAIAFAHFITQVNDGRQLLNDIRVVIDDPISSLDANHLFNTYAIIRTQLFNCRQLFILTHNFEFYSLMRQWANEDARDKKPWSIYLIERDDLGQSSIQPIPKELLKFNSEYHYLFSKLYEYSLSTAADFSQLLALPNMVRRFMEAFGGIMIPISKRLKDKMDRIFPNAIERERVWKFINDFSHNTTVTRSLTIPDTSECKAVIKACLGAVEAWDKQYYDELVAEVT